MIRRPPRSTRTYTLFPYTTLFRSLAGFLLVPAGDVPVYLAMSVACGLIAVGMTGEVRKRGRLLRTGVYVGLAAFFLAALFGMIPFSHGGGGGVSWRGFFSKSGMVISVGLLTGMVVSGLLPILESLFSITTEISWLELSDPNHKIMRRLQIEAPGTFQHSLAVASLAEAAAEEIGANASMCRVCSYFHDIGKLNKPGYFVENQIPGENPHDDLTPSMSALIIISHVKNGVDMAVREKLNPRIIDVIREHHGDSLTYFFYRKAQEQRQTQEEKVAEGTEDPGDLPDIEARNFRYPGPRPQGKESAIISLADIVESASRSLKKATPGKISAFVDDLVMGRVRQGQLDNSGLTLGELRLIRESFSKTLRSMMHSRVKYPAGKKEQKAFESSRNGKVVPREELEKARRERSG